MTMTIFLLAGAATTCATAVESATQVTVTPPTTASTVSTCVSTTGSSSGATSSVYLNKSNPTRHVTRIPINKVKDLHKKPELPENDLLVPAAPLLPMSTGAALPLGNTTALTSNAASAASENSNHIQTDPEEPYYDAIPDMPEPPVKPKLPNSLLKKRQQSPPKQQPTEPSSVASASNLASNAVSAVLGVEKEELVRKTSEKIQLAFKLFLNIQPTVTGWSATSDEFSLLFDANPLGEFVELPDHCYNLRYANLIAGAIRGAMEMVHIDVACWFVQDTLKGDNVTELRVKYLRKIEDSVPPGDED